MIESDAPVATSVNGGERHPTMATVTTRVATTENVPSIRHLLPQAGVDQVGVDEEYRGDGIGTRLRAHGGYRRVLERMELDL